MNKEFYAKLQENINAKMNLMFLERKIIYLVLVFSFVQEYNKKNNTNISYFCIKGTTYFK